LRGKKAGTKQQQLNAKHRSEYEICAAILKVVSGRQATKTRIMERAFLCSSQNKYMPILLQNGLLTATNERQTLYRITQKGISFLEVYDGPMSYYIKLFRMRPKSIWQL
jgi:predicted transcriptional regulator